MEFHPRALLVAGTFVALLWIAESDLGLVTLATLAAIAFEAIVCWGLWRAIPDHWFSWFRRRRV